MDLNVISDYKILEETLSKVVNPSNGTVEMGGLFKPSTCRARIKVCKHKGQISVICRRFSKSTLFQLSNTIYSSQIYTVFAPFTAKRSLREKNTTNDINRIAPSVHKMVKHT